MDLNIIILEIADLIIHFDYYDTLVSDAIAKGANSAGAQDKISNRSKEHLAQITDGDTFYDSKKQLRPLSEIKIVLKEKLEGMKAAQIHELIDKLQKDAKKIKKLYKESVKK